MLKNNVLMMSMLSRLFILASLALVVACHPVDSEGVLDESDLVTGEQPPPVDELAIARDEVATLDIQELEEPDALTHSCVGDRAAAPTEGIVKSDLGTDSTSNPHGLAVRVKTPFAATTETHSDWGPPGHWKPWGGDWAADLWKDQGAGSFGYSCGAGAYLDVEAVQVPGGQLAHEVRARVAAEGFACASGVYSQGGYMQRYTIEARYGSTWYDLGWVLMAHLDGMVYNPGDTFNPVDAYVGSTFQGGTLGPCWGSCHLHIEFYNNSGYSCYDLLPPTAGIGADEGVGVLGGNLAAGNCPDLGGGGGPPTTAPTGLTPDGWATISGPSVPMSWSPVSNSTTYNVYVLYWNGSQWTYYYDWDTSTSSFTLWPQFRGRHYAWKVTPKNSQGAGPGSAWAYFYFP